MTRENIIEALKAVDLPGLNKLYADRRESFSKKIKPGQHADIRNNFVHALISTDLCMETFREFLDSVTRKLQANLKEEIEEQSTYESSSDQIREEIDSIHEAIQKMDEHNVDETYKNSIDLRISLAKSAIHTQKMTAEFSSTTKTLSANVLMMTVLAIHTSLQMLYSTSDLSLVVNIVIVSLKNLAGLIPVAGPIGTYLWDLYETVNDRAKHLDKTSDELTKLDNYDFATFHWCVSVQALIDLNDGRLAPDAGSLETKEQRAVLEQTVQQRFQDLVHAYVKSD